MIQRNSTLAVLRESFVAGSDENLSPIMHHLWKMEGGAIYFCRSGWAHVTIDLKEYEIVKNTQVVLLPGSIIQSPNQKIPDRKTKCVIKTHINIKQNVIFSAKLKPV